MPVIGWVLLWAVLATVIAIYLEISHRTKEFNLRQERESLREQVAWAYKYVTSPTVATLPGDRVGQPGNYCFYAVGKDNKAPYWLVWDRSVQGTDPRRLSPDEVKDLGLPDFHTFHRATIESGVIKFL
ncbi:MAG: hypothetical protein HYW33_02325 [Candidatus Blackburnbacteria bacterium]|nr:hypothetical protein [Candidatus Blackburnbacteria bacterium]